MTFPMTDQEILKNWRCSNQNEEQVKILAQLNGCPARQIAEKLSALGVNVPEYNFSDRCPTEGKHRGAYRSRMKWVDDHDRIIIQMYKDNCLVSEIASKLGCGIATVQYRRQTMMYYLEAWSADDESKLIAMFDDGASFDEMAKRFGKSEQSCKAKLFDIYNHRAAKWTSKDEAKLIQLRKSGMSLNDLAKLFNRTKSAVQTKLTAMNFCSIEGRIKKC